MGISISIIAGQDEAASSVNASGTVQHIITNVERTTFGLGDKQLKDAINASHGKSPDDAFLHSKTPWGDLYKVYSWPQVKMVLVVQSAEILGITSEPVIVKSQEFVNNSSQKATFNVAISESVNNTASSNWSKGGTLSIGQKVKYSIGFLGTKVSGESSLSFSRSWGEGGQESKSITVGSTASVSVPLDPGESVLAALSASRGVMRVRVRYNAYLIGSTAVNYDPPYKDHHFFGLNIGYVMSQGRISQFVKSTEDIEIGYYSNSKIELKDPKTSALKATYMSADSAGE